MKKFFIAVLVTGFVFAGCITIEKDITDEVKRDLEAVGNLEWGEEDIGYKSLDEDLKKRGLLTEEIVEK